MQMQRLHTAPLAGIEWDEQAAYREFGGPPNNWDPATVDNNILRKLPVEDVEGSDWDPKSVMHYPFPPGIILSPAQYAKTGIRPPGGMSEGDILWVRLPVLVPLRRSRLNPPDAPLHRAEAPLRTAPKAAKLCVQALDASSVASVRRIACVLNARSTASHALPASAITRATGQARTVSTSACR